jgi:hypothetical protein
MVTQDELIDLWLLPEYGITLQEAEQEDFFDKYPVSQEAHDKWEDLAEQFIAKSIRRSRKFVRINKAGWYLNTAPKVREDGKF